MGSGGLGHWRSRHPNFLLHRGLVLEAIHSAFERTADALAAGQVVMGIF